MRTGRIYPDAIVRPLSTPLARLSTAVAVVALPAAASGALSAPADLLPPRTQQTLPRTRRARIQRRADITTIVVSNDDAGTITFRVNIPNRAAALAGRHRDLRHRQRRKPGDGRSPELRRRLRPRSSSRARSICSSGTDPTSHARRVAVVPDVSYSWARRSDGPDQRRRTSATRRRFSFAVRPSSRDARSIPSRGASRLHELSSMTSRPDARPVPVPTSRSRSRRSS